MGEDFVHIKRLILDRISGKEHSWHGNANIKTGMKASGFRPEINFKFLSQNLKGQSGFWTKIQQINQLKWHQKVT